MPWKEKCLYLKLNQTFYGFCHCLQADSQNSISDCPWSFPIYYLFAVQVLKCQKFQPDAGSSGAYVE